MAKENSNPQKKVEVKPHRRGEPQPKKQSFSDTKKGRTPPPSPKNLKK